MNSNSAFLNLLKTMLFPPFIIFGNNKGIIHVGCNAYARRGFDEAFKTVKSLKNSKIALVFYRRIYKIEKELRENLNNKKIDEKTFELERKKQAMPLFDKFKKWMLKMQNEILPQSLTGNAIYYTLNELDKLIRYLDVWYLTPDNNIAENVEDRMSEMSIPYGRISIDQSGRLSSEEKIDFSLIHMKALGQMPVFIH